MAWSRKHRAAVVSFYSSWSSVAASFLLETTMREKDARAPRFVARGRNAARGSLRPLSIVLPLHYPQCNGGADWSLKLTHVDKNGAACVYGPAPGFQVDAQICQERG